MTATIFTGLPTLLPHLNGAQRASSHTEAPNKVPTAATALKSNAESALFHVGEPNVKLSAELMIH